MISFYVDKSILYPDDLAKLPRVFDLLCADGGLDIGSTGAELIAGTLLDIFQNGTCEEAALLAELRQQRSFRKIG
ncbi:hypothetical protein [Mesorhizobium sp. 131-2-1]|uniref:hypothetical protein n=1 Tax=Mesorhizobium sp. 131-2-1 TaxID=2744518 RepID=UPI001926F5C5|nr:hypothetical protein [Mesorhizobium sp. 131-2-1]BCG96711.1 hypothetical protein MesoLj131a_55750 [Mesorhizobium sp. 131-2-1]